MAMTEGGQTGVPALNEKSLGQKLQAARRAAGLTQQELCERANLSYSTLTKIERGAIRAPSIFTVHSIADAVGTSLDALLGRPGAAAGKAEPKHRTRDGASFIYFDINGSLVHFFQRAFASIAEDSGASAEAIESTYWQHNDAVCRGTMSLSDFNATMAKRLGLKSFDWQKYYLEALEPIKPMQQLLTWTAEHYRVGLLTNIMPSFISAMQRRGLLPALPYDAIVDSSEVGAIKPEKKIYEVALQRAGCPANEVLLIDDTRTNLIAAEKLGWRALWFDDYRPKESVAHIRALLEPAN